MVEPPGHRSASPAAIAGAIGRYELLVLTTALWFLGKFLRYAFPPLFDTFQTTYDVSTADVGVAFSVFMALYALLQFPSGALADRFDSALVIAAGGVLAGAGALWVALEPPFAVLMLAMAVMGAGTGAHKTVAVRLLSNAHPDHFGRSLGVFDTVGATGGIAAPVLLAAVLGLAALDWAGLFAATGVAFIATGVTFLVRMRRRDGRDGGPASSDRVLPWRSYLSTFQRPPVVLFVGVTVLMAFAYNGVVAFLPLFLTEAGGLSGPTASLLYSVLFVATFAQLVTGEAADRVGALRTVTAGLATMALALAGLVALVAAGDGDLTGTGPILVVGAVVLVVGLGGHGYRPARDVYIVGLVPDATAGGSLGVFRTLLMTSAAVSPAAVGIAAEAVGFLPAFVGLTAVAGGATTLAVVAAVLQGRTRS